MTDVTAKRPNVILFTTDQQRWDAWGLMNTEILTPHLDAVFTDGLRWRNAVCQVPMCIPSRYSYMNGLYPSQIGSRMNAQTYQDPAQMPVKVLAQYLRDGGYHTIGCGKTHYAMGADDALGIAAAIPDNRGFDRRAAAGDRGCKEAGPDARLWGVEDPQAKLLFAEIEHSGSLPFPAGGEGRIGYAGSDWPLGLDRTREGWATACAIDFLDEAITIAKPWFLNLSFDLPHAPFCTVRAFEELYTNRDITVPDEPPAGLFAHWGIFENTRNFLDHWQLLDTAGKRGIIIKYYALCSMMDALFGKLIGWLRANGQLDNTWIIFTSDHGESLGDRGRFSKYSLYESSIRVPMALSGPGLTPQQRGSEMQDPAELIDLLPTILDLAGLPKPQWLPGRNLLTGPNRSGSFAEMHGSGAEEFQAAPIFMWRTPEWKLILSLPGHLTEADISASPWRGELYHLTVDPLELDNRYHDPALRDTRESMTLALLRTIACVHAKFPRPDTRPKL